MAPKAKLHKLSTKQVEKAVQPGRVGDGGGLWLQVRDRERRSWLFRFMLDGKAREMGLGPVRDVTLAEAREAAAAARKVLLAGNDPIIHREAERSAAAQRRGRTFKVVAEEYLAAHRAEWRNPKHRAQWTSTLETYAYPKIGALPVEAVGLGSVTDVLRPIWNEKPETASRLRGRIEAVLDFATVHGWRLGDNPARWDGHLSEIFGAPRALAPVKHHPALPYAEIGTFVAGLRQREAIAARALEFVILTAARTSEVLGARWGEIDLKAATWRVPKARMKAAVEHTVALSPAAVELLKRVMPKTAPDGADLIFPTGRRNRPLSINAMRALLIRMKLGDRATVHGFRSAFRTWAAERTAFPREIVEAALAHTNKDKVEAAYLRSDHMGKRAKLMATWAMFCARPTASGKVTQFQAAG